MRQTARTKGNGQQTMAAAAAIDRVIFGKDRQQ